jgi:hypothetical protein
MYESSTLAVRRPPLALYGAGQEKLAAAEKRLTEESEVWKVWKPPYKHDY